MPGRFFHKGVWIALFALRTTGISAQTGMHQVQAVVDGVRSPQHAQQATELIRPLPGVLMCRTDHNTRNLFVQLTPESPVDEARLEEVIAPLGMALRCYRRTPVEGTPFRHLDPRTCGQPPPAR